MLIIIGKYISTGRFEKTDPETGIKRVDKSYRIHVPYPDGTILAETIYFPRDFDGRTYQEPNLTPQEEYAFPVTARPTKDGKKISYTARPDKQPFTAPKKVG